MLQLHKIKALLFTVLASALIAPATSVAQDFSDSDSREIASYVLNEASLQKYAKATRSLGDIKDQLPSSCDDEEGVQSLDAAAARLGAIPDVRVAIESAGMTTREYMVFSFSLFQNGLAAWVLSQPGGGLPPGTSMANVDFYRSHEATLQELGSLTESDNCDDDAGDDYGDDDDNDDDYDEEGAAAM
jgi:hypothetical protein